MKKLCYILLLISGENLWGQSNLDTATRLSEDNQFLASTALLEQFIEDHPDRYFDLSQAYFLISYNYLQLGDYQAALAANDQSHNIRDRIHSENISENYMRAGAVHLMMGDYERAIDLLYTAYNLPIENPQNFALTTGYMASAQQALGNYEKALNGYQQAKEILEIELGDDHPDIATNYYNIGTLYLDWGKTDRAQDALEKGLAIAERWPDRRDQLGRFYAALGLLYSEIDPAKAMDYYHQAEGAFQLAYGDYHPELIRTKLQLAKIAIYQDDPVLAQVQVSAALEKLLPAGEMGPMAEASTIDGLLLAEAWQLKALLQLSAQDEGTLKEALSSCERAVQLLNHELNLRYGDAAQLQILQQLYPVYETGLKAALKVFQLTGAIEYQERAFQLAEAGRANLLRTQRMNVGDLAIQYPALVQQEQLLKNQLRQEEALLALAPTDAKQRQAKITAFEKYQQFLKQVEKQHPGYYQALFSTASPAVANIQQKLGDQTSLLEYFIGEEDYYIFALSDDKFETIRLPKKTALLPEFKKIDASWKGLVAKGKASPGVYSKLENQAGTADLDQAIDGFLTAIQKIRPRELIDNGFQLYGKLIEPVEQVIKHSENLIIVPHGPLHQLPFEAIITQNVDAEKKLKYHKLNYLVKDYAIQYAAFAGEVLTKSPPPSITELEPFLAMAPIFTQDSIGSYIRESNRFLFDTLYQSNAALRAISSDGRLFQPLKHSEQEVRNILQLFADKKVATQAYFSDQALETTFKEEAPSYKYIHLATHSFVNRADSQFSGVAFFQAKAEQEDGILYLPEIYPLEMNAELVVLSSCESGRGEYALGEGTLSLTRAFLVAGADHVLSTLWNVYDRYASELMTEFYGELLKDKTTAAALRKAKLKMIGDKDTANPKIWSGFILSGKWLD